MKGVYKGEKRIKVVLDPADQEASQIESYVFDPYGNPEEYESEPEVA